MSKRLSLALCLSSLAVVSGCATPEAESGANVARIAALRAGLPHTVPAVTVNRFCSSGSQTIAMAAERIDKLDVVEVELRRVMEMKNPSIISGRCSILPGVTRRCMIQPMIARAFPRISVK